jgi:phosphate transport system permease protein
MVWLTGGALVFCLAMIVILLVSILIQGAATFWPRRLLLVQYHGKQQLGEEVRQETIPSSSTESGKDTRELLRVDNFELNSATHVWVNTSAVEDRQWPKWALTIERLTKDGRFYGLLGGFRGTKPDAGEETDDPERAWQLFLAHFPEVVRRLREQDRINRNDIGALNREVQAAKRAVDKAQLDYGLDSEEYRARSQHHQQVILATEARKQEFTKQIAELAKENSYYDLLLTTADGKKKTIPLEQISRAYPANELTVWQRLSVYFSRWWEFLSSEPRNANREGGVLPAIWGTAAMTLLMSVAVVPFGVMAALYLREYARAGAMISIIRIAINNLAGVPGIVFGVFGLGFFCHFVGVRIDDLLFRPEKLIAGEATFGREGLLWAALTLALLTLPVVIVATEEALAAVPSSMREGSYACGASKWQTLWRIVLPRATPGILTGMVLAMARGAGEVAPLMLLGVKKLAPELAVDTVFPYIHPQRSFLHLGFHIYDIGLQSPDSEAARPLVYTTTLLLLAIIASLSLTAMWFRARLRRRYSANQF